MSNGWIYAYEDMLSIADVHVAFCDGESHGTKQMIETARVKGITVWVFSYNNIKHSNAKQIKYH